MAAIELYKQDGTTAGIYYCSECRIVHRDKEQADWCHGERVCACGKKITQGYFQKTCNDCQWAEVCEKGRLKEAERFEKARKITEDQYDGDMVYLDDKYYESVLDAIDEYDVGTEPEYVWACKDVGVPRASSDSIVEHCLDNMWEDADSSDLNGLEELDAAIAAFNEANKGISVWYPDYTTAILVNPDNGRTENV